MAIPFEKLVEEDLHRGYGQVEVTTPPGGTRSGTQIGLHTWTGMLSVKDFGAVGDNQHDDTAAFQAAIDVATGLRNATIFIPTGEYVIRGRLTIPQGIVLKGPGSQGSSEAFGSTIRHCSNDHCFNFFPATGAALGGTGGGLRNLLIVKDAGFRGGDAIHVENVDAEHRCGEMIFENVLIYGLRNMGQWDRGVNIDGTATDTPGNRGVRSVLLHKVRVSDCRVDNEFVVVNQGVHIFSTYLQIDPGHSSGTPGLTVKGNFDNIMLTGLNIGGNFIVDAPPAGGTANMVVSGRISRRFDQNFSSLVGCATVDVNTGPLTNASKLFRIMSNHVDSFAAVRNVEISNQTGDGTVVTVTYTIEQYDYNDTFDAATGIFTCRSAGIYQFDATVSLRNILSASFTRGDIYLQHRNADASTIASYSCGTHIFNIADPAGNAALTISRKIEMSEGDTMAVAVSVVGSTKTVSIGTTAATINTWFTGALAP